MSRQLIKRIDMALHIQELCAKHSISVSYCSLSEKTPRYYANRVDKSIMIRPTKNTGYYVSALHEIGHIIGFNQSADFDRLEREIGAWKYAMVNAIVWTETATKIMKKALSSYGVTETQWEGVWNQCLDFCKKTEKEMEVNNA
jgi:hypothetical protein